MREPTPPPARPIGSRRRSRSTRAVVIVVVLVVALGVLAWWSGALGARVDVTVESHDWFERTGQGEVVTEVHNLGMVPIDVRAVYLQPDRGWVRSLSPDSIRLGPRESGELVVLYQVDCTFWDGDQRPDPIAVEASPSVGRASTTPLRLEAALAACEADSDDDTALGDDSAPTE